MASMTVGNIMALRQVNVKRMLAYSYFACGFMLNDFIKRNQMLRKFVVLHFGLCLDRNRCVQRYSLRL
jgi:NADH:ubiquinone oxidoreductase subunit 2 (subunit N)